ncbi:zinc finger A20 and AN1 domain-containing stress-associated 5-like, partial [Olea europaea subsp. europaea]
AIAVGSASTVVMTVARSKKSFGSSGDIKGLKKEDLDSTEVVLVKREVNRRFGCRQKVGLIEFRCRCGELFYADHRHSYQHDCSYDYKATGREAISRENSMVKAAKIVKI